MLCAYSGSSVGIATGYVLEARGPSLSPVVSRIFIPSFNQSCNQYWGLFPRRLKWPGRETGHSPLHLVAQCSVGQTQCITTVPRGTRLGGRAQSRCRGLATVANDDRAILVRTASCPAWHRPVVARSSGAEPCSYTPIAAGVFFKLCAVCNRQPK
jgi:hypothetical protein